MKWCRSQIEAGRGPTKYCPKEYADVYLGQLRTLEDVTNKKRRVPIAAPERQKGHSSSGKELPIDQSIHPHGLNWFSS